MFYTFLILIKLVAAWLFSYVVFLICFLFCFYFQVYTYTYM